MKLFIEVTDQTTTGDATLRARVPLPEEITLDTSGPAPALFLRHPVWKQFTLAASEATTWELPDMPLTGSLDLTRNGLVLTEGQDYTLIEKTITLSGQEHAPTDLWRVKYQV